MCSFVINIHCCCLMESSSDVTSECHHSTDIPKHAVAAGFETTTKLHNVIMIVLTFYCSVHL